VGGTVSVKLIEQKFVVPVELYKGDTLQITWSFKTSRWQRSDKEVFTHKAEKQTKVDTIALWYVENEMGLKNGYVCTFGER
jgi:hypothetical protein